MNAMPLEESPTTKVIQHDPRQPSPSAVRILQQSTTVFFAIAAILAILRSHDLTAVDGAVRAFDIYNNPKLQFHGNAHMLYPVYVLGWSRIGSVLGFRLTDPLAFIRFVQLMNAVAAAASAAILYSILRSFSVSMAIAGFTTAAWTFSHAVLLHGTNSAEPLLGLCWSVLAFALVTYGLRLQRVWLLPLAGLLLAVSMASYESMVFLGLSCGLLTLLWNPEKDTTAGVRIGRSLLLTSSFVAGLIVVFGVSYYLQGLRNPSRFFRAFFAINTSIYGQFTLSKAVNAFSGFARNEVYCLPADFGGIRWLLSGHKSWLPIFLLSLASLLACYSILFRCLLLRQRDRSQTFRAVCLAATGTLILDLLLIVYWDPVYDKLWLQPLWLLALLAGLAANHLQKRISIAVAAIIVLCAVANLNYASRASRGDWPAFGEAAKVATLVAKNDLVVTDWDPVSVLYQMVWGRQQTFDFPTEAEKLHSSVAQTLSERIAEARSRGGSVYFLGILDQDRAAWNGFLGNRCNVPYDTLGRYRQQSTVVTQFATPGHTIKFWKMFQEWNGSTR